MIDYPLNIGFVSGMLAALAAAMLLAQSPQDTTAEKPTLLVMPLRAESKLAVSARALDELILEAVGGLKRYSVLGPGDVNALLGVEKMKDAAGCDDVSCAAEIGGALGAPYLLAGELRSLGEQVVLSLRLMDTKKRTVLTRSTARGSTSADSLSQVMASAVGACFTTTIETTAAQPAGGDAATYMGLITEVSGYVSRQEYSTLLGHMDELSARAKKTKAPGGGASAEEMLTYYQAIACFTLKRADCFAAAAAHYHKAWPTGMYGSGIDSFATILSDQKTAQRDHQDEVEAQVADIQAKAKAGTYDEALAAELIAVAYYGGQNYAEAAAHYAKILARLYAEPSPQVAKIMSTTQQAVFSWQQVGNFEAARAALQRAEALDAKAYRTNGLQQTARALPK